MDFNFGNRPFAFAPPLQYTALSQAPIHCTVNNANNGSVVSPPTITPKSNSPQAIIIEVTPFPWVHK